MAATAPNESDVLHQTSALSMRISKCQSTSELIVLMHELNGLLGLSGSIYTSFVRDDSSWESYRFINTCPAIWCQQYSANAWYMIDPCLLYALSNTKPVFLNDVPLRTSGQRKMMEAARAFGFSTGLIVPAHSPAGQSRLGVLYLASDAPGQFARTVAIVEPILRAISGELLDWWTLQIRAELLGGANLSNRDIEVLRLIRDGYGSKEIARLIGVTANAVDQRAHRLAVRLSATSRRQAAQLAHQYGLLT